MPATSSPRSFSKPAALTTGLCLAALTAFAADKAAPPLNVALESGPAATALAAVAGVPTMLNTVPTAGAAE